MQLPHNKRFNAVLECCFRGGFLGGVVGFGFRFFARFKSDSARFGFLVWFCPFLPVNEDWSGFPYLF
jgi:hypothetical protein